MTGGVETRPLSIPIAIARKIPSPTARRVGSAFALGILKPVTVALGWAGVWPRIVPRAMRAMHSSFSGYVPNERDVLVCSYFKSGTNWTMQMAVQIAFRGHAEFEHVHDLVPWPDLPARAAFAVDVRNDSLYDLCPTGRKVIKTHLIADQLPWNDGTRYICVVRDPKDVFVSSYHFTRSVMLGPLMPSVEQWLDLYLSDETPMGSWAGHLEGFWRRRHEPNVLFLTFEEMKADIGRTIEQIAATMGVDLDEDAFASVRARSSFEEMKRDSRKFDPIGLGPAWADAAGSMIRRGRVGGSGELLSADQRQRIDDFWSAELARLGSTFPYDATYRN